MPNDVHNSHYEKLPNGDVRCIDDEIPFEIPGSWAWVRIRNVAEIARGGSPRPIKDYLTTSPNGVNWIKIGDTDKGGKYINSTKEKIIQQGVSRSRMIHKGDFLLTNSMSFGRPYISNINGCIHDGWLVISPYPNSYYQDFLYYLLSSQFAYNQFAGKVSGAVVQNLNSDKVADALFPIPPITEQIRIVKKIEELEPYIEEYSSAQHNLDILDNSVFLLLKKSILQEAIQGRLVAQDPSDEPAIKILERIKQEKQALVKKGKLKVKDITDSTIFKGDDNKYYEKCGNTITCIDEEIPFEIPTNWNWCRLGDLITTKTGLAYSKPNLEIKSDDMVRVLRGGNISNGSWCMKADDVMISSEFVKPELYLRKGYFITPAVTSWENMGKTALVREDYDGVVVGGFVLMMCPFYIDGTIEEYLNYFFQSVLFQQYCRSITNKSGQAFYNLSRNKLLQLLVPIPPIAEQQRIVDKINNATASIMSR